MSTRNPEIQHFSFPTRYIPFTYVLHLGLRTEQCSQCWDPTSYMQIVCIYSDLCTLNSLWITVCIFLTEQMLTNPHSGTCIFSHPVTIERVKLKNNQRALLLTQNKKKYVVKISRYISATTSYPVVYYCIEALFCFSCLPKRKLVRYAGGPIAQMRPWLGE